MPIRVKEIKIILRLFLFIAMSCQGNTSQIKLITQLNWVQFKIQKRIVFSGYYMRKYGIQQNVRIQF